MASVIYLTDNRFGRRAWDHPSARHRCYHYADALLAVGENSSVVPMESVSVEMLAGFEHAIFHRPTDNGRFRHALKCCQSASIQIHADYDDLVFLSEFAECSPLFINGNQSIDKVKNQFARNHRAASCFKNFISSTEYLGTKLQKEFPESLVSVVPNSLPRLFNAPSINIDSNAPLTVGYFPGSKSHAKDFKVIYESLRDLLIGDIRLLIAGRMDKRDYSGLDNVTYVPFTGYDDYLRMLSMVDLSVAPLVENVFNESKSAVKLIESVSVGTPVLATENQDMRDHENSLSVLINHAANWRQSLHETLYTAREMREQHKAAAMELADQYSVKSRLPLLREHLQCAA